MIPKIIHYCWFGGKELPVLAEKCLNSWRKYLPDYEIIRWDETNFDINIIPYTQQAYAAGKYAFVSDYARFWILYKYGGLYFDTDVEVIRPLNDIIAAGPFMGCENSYEPERLPSSLGVAPGLGLGVTPNHSLYKEILTLYSKLQFKNNDGSLNLKTVVEYTTELLCKRGLINTAQIQIVEGINIYPKEYFCPIDYNTNKKEISLNTRTIHHYAGSWQGSKEKIFNFIKKIIGYRRAKFLTSIWKKL